MKFNLGYLSRVITGSVLCAASLPVCYGQSTANTSFWTGAANNGLWNTASNWNFGPNNLPATIAPQGQTTQNQNVLFSNSGNDSVVITLSLNTRLSPFSGFGDFTVRDGNFIFDLNNRTLQFADFYLGDPLGATNASVLFTNSSATARSLTLSSIVLGGFDNSYSFADVMSNLAGSVGNNVSLSFAPGRGVILAGRSNTLVVNSGEIVNDIFGNGVTIQALSADQTNNRIEVNGGSLNSGVITIGGYYDGSNPDNTVRSNNEFVVRQSGNVKVSQSSLDLVNVGPGSELRVETGGKLMLDDTSGFGLQRNLNIAEHGRLVLDGDGSQISATAAAGYKLNVAGSAEVTDGASLGNLGVLSVASTGYALVKDTTLSRGALEVSGVAEFKNADFTNVGNISVNGGHLLVDEGSRFDSNGSTGTLQVSAGGTLDIKNNSEVRTYYLFGSGAGITVEQGSTLYFDKWTTGRLSVQGTAIWGTGEKNGPHPTQDDSHLEATISAGTTLLLGGGSYDLDGEQKIGSGSTATRISRAGKFTVESGGVLGGSGHIGNNPNFTGSGSDNQTFVEVRGGSLQPGTDNAAGALYFHDGVSFLENPSSITFSVFNTSEYDQILTSSITVAIGVTIKLELTQDFLAFLDDLSVLGPEEIALFFASSDPFQFIGNLDGLARLVPGSFVFDYGTSAGQLAEYGLGWDVSNFAGTGAVGITAVPEPGVSVLAGIGLAVVLWSRSRRRNPVAA